MRIDTPALHLRLRTDGGRHVDLAVANVDAMRTVHTGDHVQVDVDGQDIVLNINKTLSPPHPISYSRG